MAALPTAVQTFGIGLDLGATTACIAMCKGGQPEVIANEDGNRLTQASIGWTEEEILVGDEAYNQKERNPLNTIVLAKKLLGKEFEDEGVQEDISAKLFGSVTMDATESGMVKLTNLPGVEECSVEEIVKMIFERMHRTGSMYLGENIAHVCISVPSHFSQTQCDEVVKACGDAGMKVMRCVKEPVAAAMAMGLDSKTDKTVCVFDFGGSSLDVSILRVDSLGCFTVLGGSGAGTVGAASLDKLIFDFCIKEFRRKDRANAMKMDDRAKLRLKEACKKAKHSLSASTTAHIDVEALVGDVDFHATISRNMFEDLIEKDEGDDNIKDLFADILEEAYTEAFGEEGEKCTDLTGPAKVDTVLFCGGGVKTLKVQEVVKEFFGEKEENVEFLSCDADASNDELVALGCAVQADLLLNDGDSFGALKGEISELKSKSKEAEEESIALASNVLSAPLGLQDASSTFHTVLPAGAALPVRKSVEVEASGEVLVNVAEAQKSLGKVMFPASGKQSVEFAVSAEGVLTVKCGEKEVVFKN